MKHTDTGSKLMTVDILGICVCVVITAAGFYACFRPVLKQRAEIAQQKQQLVEYQREADQLIQSLTKMRQDFRDTQLRVEANSVRLESTDYLNQRLSRITALATESGLEIDEIKPGQGIPSEHFVRVPIHLTGRGLYPSSSAFLHGLHESLPDISVRSLVLSSKANSRQSDPEFVFELYWYAAPKLMANVQ